jgi:hypothetical protein
MDGTGLGVCEGSTVGEGVDVSIMVVIVLTAGGLLVGFVWELPHELWVKRVVNKTVRVSTRFKWITSGGWA